MKLLNFRKFLELQQIEPNYLDKIQDDLGIDPDAISKSPQWLTNSTLGKTTYNGLTYQIVKYMKDGNGQITGAMIRPMDTKRAFVKDNKDRYIYDPTDSNKQYDDDGHDYFINKDELNKILNQEAGQQSPQGGGMPQGI